MAYSVKKANHNGAKNGGGYYGYRADAKKGSSKVRRADDKRAVKEA